AGEPQDVTAPDQPPDIVAPSLPDELPELPSGIVEMAPQVNQMVGTVGTLTQGIVQGAQGATQSQPLTDPTDKESEKDDAGDRQPEEQAEGAAAGPETLDRVPTQPGPDAPAVHPYTNQPAAPRRESL